MKAGIVALVAAYVLSQFYRAFLAVLSPGLQRDLDLGPEALADASGLWFLAFGLAQLPIGIALDRVGPRRTAAVLLAVGGAGGALLFARAESGGMIGLAMVMIGAGCAPVLMAAFYIFARLYPPAVFATLAGTVIGIGNLGNLGAALPLSLAVEAFGWRGSMLGLSVITLAAALLLWRFVGDPPPLPPREGRERMSDVLRNPALWAVLAMLAVSYAPAAAVRGLWIGPYFDQVYGFGAAGIGTMTLVMGAAMIAGSIGYGPMDRIFGTRKGVILAGNMVALACLGLLWWQPQPAVAVAIGAITLLGIFGLSFPLMMAHGRAFFPPHLIGRGVTLLNLFSVGGAGLWQMLSGPVFAAAPKGAAPAVGFGMVFGLFAALLLAGSVIYALWAQDRTD